MTKRSEKNRIDYAVKICKNNKMEFNFCDSYNRVKKLVKECLDQLCKISGYNGQNIEYKIVDVNFNNKITHLKEGECFFIKFTSDGYVVVVGAGYDYGISMNDRYLNVKIIKKLGKNWSDNAILIFVKGIKTVKGRRGSGKAGCEHILQCRNGVEMYLGEYLLTNEVPILNLDSHKNYSKKYFEDNIKKVMKK
ncbi:hypothetical protein [Parvimonas micra]